MFNAFEMEEEQNATVHGLVLEVLPVKQSRNVLLGKISDGKKVARMIQTNEASLLLDSVVSHFSWVSTPRLAILFFHTR